MKIWKRIYAILGIGICFSCQFFDTERISSETFYKEELESISWDHVDTYPLFKECENNMEIENQKSCFQGVIVTAIQSIVSQESNVVNIDIKDTLHILLQVEKTGEIILKEIDIDTLLAQKIPNLKAWLDESINHLPVCSPAYKRGIPVTTQITLPFVLNSEEL